MAIRKYSILQVHEMETVDCDLSCSGCYLKSGMGDPHMDMEAFLDKVEPNPEVYYSFYLNNLKRDTKEALERSPLYGTLMGEDIGGKRMKANLVTDSLTANSLDFNFVSEHFDELVFSPRSKGSLLKLLEKLGENPIPSRILYTLDVDNLDLLHDAISHGVKRVEVNNKKPIEMATYLKYNSLMNTLRELDLESVTGDGCMQYVSSGRNCHDPEDDVLEVTTFKEQSKLDYRFYSCAYPSNKCIAKM